MANDGVSETGIKLLVSMPRRRFYSVILQEKRQKKSKKNRRRYRPIVTPQTEQFKMM